MLQLVHVRFDTPFATFLGNGAEIESMENNEYDIPSTTADLRIVTGGGACVAGGGRSAAAAPAFASVNAGGVRPRRRGAGASPLKRSGFGQASSNDGGGSSLDSAGGSGPRSGPGGLPIRPRARSRPFREHEGNNALRPRLAGCAGLT